ncbi:MAG: LysM peptidoglycan-binding domain-containing protein [Clostridia bacterium]|nr:LysM peptidoglycan-binding domain-containing protein [Clostridia bacterium]
MFSLVTERGKYLRIRKRVKREDVISTFSIPAGEVFFGEIIELGSPVRSCRAQVGDTYAKIALRERVDEEELRALNNNAAIYPTLRVWLP